MNIKALIHQINQKPNISKISANNRLVVVHNMIDVDREDTLSERILEVQSCYEIDNSAQAWAKSTVIVHVDSKPLKFTYYNTPFTTHVFMVRHPKDPAQSDWCFVRNMSAVEALKQILQRTNVKPFNLVKSFKKAAEIWLPRYLEEWGDLKLELEESKSGKGNENALFLPSFDGSKNVESVTLTFDTPTKAPVELARNTKIMVDYFTL